MIAEGVIAMGMAHWKFLQEVNIFLDTFPGNSGALAPSGLQSDHVAKRGRPRWPLQRRLGTKAGEILRTMISN